MSPGGTIGSSTVREPRAASFVPSSTAGSTSTCALKSTGSSLPLRMMTHGKVQRAAWHGPCVVLGQLGHRRPARYPAGLVAELRRLLLPPALNLPVDGEGCDDGGEGRTDAAIQSGTIRYSTAATASGSTGPGLPLRTRCSRTAPDGPGRPRWKTLSPASRGRVVSLTSASRSELACTEVMPGITELKAISRSRHSSWRNSPRSGGRAACAAPP
jgi:hypothetical protein